MRVKVKNGNVEQALRLFKRKITESNVLFDYKEKQYHEKKTTRRQKKKGCGSCPRKKETRQ